MNGLVGRLYPGDWVDDVPTVSDLTWRRLLLLIVEYRCVHVHDHFAVPRTFMLCDAGTVVVLLYLQSYDFSERRRNLGSITNCSGGVV